MSLSLSVWLSAANWCVDHEDSQVIHCRVPHQLQPARHSQECAMWHVGSPSAVTLWVWNCSPRGGAMSLFGNIETFVNVDSQETESVCCKTSPPWIVLQFTALDWGQEVIFASWLCHKKAHSAAFQPLTIDYMHIFALWPSGSLHLHLSLLVATNFWWILANWKQIW